MGWISNQVSPLALAMMTAIVAACTGGLDDDPLANRRNAPGSTPDGTTNTNTSCTGGALVAGDAPVRRLTRAQYNATVRDLLGDTTSPADSFVADGSFGAFQSNKDVPVTTLIATQYMNAAQKLATHATANIKSFAPCAAGGPEDKCARDTVTAFGQKAYRRPLSDAEIARLTAIFTTQRAVAGASFQSAMSIVLQVILQAPSFINHIEYGDIARAKDGVAPLTGYEVASRLSYALWGTMPDQALFDAAAQNKLDTVADVEAQVRRMLDDPRARDGIQSFYSEWFALDKVDVLTKSAAQFPEFNPALRTAMRAETEKFVSSVLWDGDAHLETLLGASFTFVNGPLAALYGIPGVTGDAFVRVELDPKQRRGVFGQAAFLASNSHEAQTSPVHRGKFIRERILCQPMPPPPATASTNPPAADATLTTRQRFAQHSADPACAGCHRLMDPIGLAFEELDGDGKYRTTENNLPIDASGELIGTDVDGKFNGLSELVDKLSKSDQVRQCVAKQWFRYALERGETAEDKCPLDLVNTDFSKSGYSLKELIVLVAKSDSFRFRKLDTSAGACQ
ncbi:MAG: Cellulose-binding domain protein [Myxococcaceae bacterium]|nr:Cellulose-binding domain protein [Myxococcaceae bacterium]